MDAQFDISVRDDVLVVIVKGIPTAADIEQILAQTRGDSGYTHTLRLWDFREADFSLSNEDLKKLADSASRGDIQPARVALLAGKDLSFGVSRIYETYRKSDKTRVTVFRDEKKAMRWLRSKT